MITGPSGKYGVSRAERETIMGSTMVAYFDIVGVPGSEAVIDCSQFAGKPVRCSILGAAVHYCFAQEPTDNIDRTKSFTPRLLAPDIILAGGVMREIVPPDYPFLLLLCVSPLDLAVAHVRRA